MDMGAMAMAAAPAGPGAPFPHPQHVGWLGHMLPGGFFLFWGSWWLLGVFRLALRATPRAPYAGRAWFDLPWAPRRVPLEPLFKVALPFIGINGELWFGHESWRRVRPAIAGSRSAALRGGRRRAQAPAWPAL